MTNFTFYDFVDSFQESYQKIHPYLSSVVCSVGMLLNLVNIIVLTKMRMKLYPVNVILTAISICDFCVMTTYLMFTQVEINGLKHASSSAMFYWAVFVLIHSNASVVLHATSIWLTVLLACIRVFSVLRALKRVPWQCSAKMAARYSVIILSIILLIDIPTMMSFTIEERWISVEPLNSSTSASSRLFYATTISDIAMHNDRFLLKVIFWLNGILFKVLPCMLQSVLIALLLSLLKRARRLRSGYSSNAVSRSLKDHDRSTPMLIVLLTAFVTAELPQGLLLMGTALFKDFRTKVYMKSGAFMDLLSLLNSAITFVIYTCMSAAFRRLFFAIFMPFFRSTVPYESGS